MRKQFYRTPIENKAEVVSWTELNHICSASENGLRYFGNHMDDDFDRVYALFGGPGDRTKKFYCVLLFS